MQNFFKISANFLSLLFEFSALSLGEEQIDWNTIKSHVLVKRFASVCNNKKLGDLSAFTSSRLSALFEPILQLINCRIRLTLILTSSSFSKSLESTCFGDFELSLFEDCSPNKSLKRNLINMKNLLTFMECFPI